MTSNLDSTRISSTGRLQRSRIQNPGPNSSLFGSNKSNAENSCRRKIRVESKFEVNVWFEFPPQVWIEFPPHVWIEFPPQAEIQVRIPHYLVWILHEFLHRFGSNFLHRSESRIRNSFVFHVWFEFPPQAGSKNTQNMNSTLIPPCEESPPSSKHTQKPIDQATKTQKSNDCFKVSVKFPRQNRFCSLWRGMTVYRIYPLLFYRHLFNFSQRTFLLFELFISRKAVYFSPPVYMGNPKAKNRNNINF